MLSYARLHNVNFVFIPLTDALHKITALEGELARLKAQIAVFALSETEGLSVPAAPPPPPPLPPMSQVLVCNIVCTVCVASSPGPPNFFTFF